MQSDKLSKFQPMASVTSVSPALGEDKAGGLLLGSLCIFLAWVRRPPPLGTWVIFIPSAVQNGCGPCFLPRSCFSG